MLKDRTINNRFKITTYMTVIIAICIVLTIIIYPKDAVDAAKNGLSTWFNIVLPSLLPFFIGSEILVGLGVVNFLGSLLNPIMGPLFNVSGKGAFPLAMSITSGYPVGVKLVSNLRLKNTITRTEAQRLSSFCSTSGPLFMIGAVSVGMFRNVSIGPLIVISHYLGAITVGIIFSYYKRNERPSSDPKNNGNYIKTALQKLLRSRKEDNRPLGVLMGDSVKEGMNTMFMVGGFIILYSVVIRILEITSVLTAISNLISFVFPFINNKEIIHATLSGVIEITNGCSLVSSVSSVELSTKISVASLLIGWSGLSIHSQSMTMLSKTDINTKIYVLAKALHGIFAFGYSYILYNFAFKNYIAASSIVASETDYIFTPTWTGVFKFSLKMWGSITLTLIILTMLVSIIYRVKSKI
ncbi:MAG: sporulation integral membrane protein YlbJ [Firmicutes bacterium]|nr:sporulation integral membrane protein YlbJ [Bacillota bacterium]